MTDIIVHLDKEHERQQRHRLLGNNVYILFHDFLRQIHKEGQTSLSHVEAFVAAERFACMLLSVPNVVEGIVDELEDLEDEAEGENDAVTVSILATAIIYTVRNSHAGFDYRSVVKAIYDRWIDHPLFDPMLLTAARKEEARWMEGKRIDLLTCEVEDIERNNGGEEAVKGLLRHILGFSDVLSAQGIQAILLWMNKYNNEHGTKYTRYINELYEKLGKKTNTQFNIDKINDIHDNKEVKIGGE